MRFYFTTNDKWYSKAHRFMANEPFTHIGLGFFIGTLNLIVDCTKPNGKVYHLDHWLKKYRAVKILSLSLENTMEQLLYLDVTNACVNTPYDWGAYYYAWLMGIRKLLFNKPYPDVNPWAGSGMWCSEIISPIKENLKDYGVDLTDVADFAALTPYMLYKKLKYMPTILEVDED